MYGQHNFFSIFFHLETLLKEIEVYLLSFFVVCIFNYCQPRDYSTYTMSSILDRLAGLSLYSYRQLVIVVSTVLAFFYKNNSSLELAFFMDTRSKELGLTDNYLPKYFIY